VRTGDDTGTVVTVERRGVAPAAGGPPMSGYATGANDERDLVDLAGSDGFRLAMRSPGSKGTYDVCVIERNGRGHPHSHTVWLIDVKRGRWAGPLDRARLALVCDRHGCIPVLANHALIDDRRIWLFRGVRKSGDLTEVWAMAPWDMERL
jgi:hypothetical protein